MIKIGDMVEVVEGGAYHDVGDIFMVRYMDDICFLDENSKAIMKEKVRPLKTEAEKRGAKFGVGGVIKATGEKWVFAQGIGLMWRGIAENGNVYTGEPHQFRLDHELEYREIPFSEATHAQRMDVGVVYSKHGNPPIEVLYTAGGYYIYTFQENAGPTMVNVKNTQQDSGITIRVPS